MKCLICKYGETHPGLAVVTLQHDEHMLVIKGMPAEICENCEEYYLSEEVAERLYAQAEGAWQGGAEVKIGHFSMSGPSERAALPMR